MGPDRPAANAPGWRRLVQQLRRASRVTVLTGAGVSSASGVPTFRGTDGFWRQYRASDLATPEAFARDPLLVWEWYAWRRERIARCVPNRAHEVIAAWTMRNPHCRLITQNVDDLHLRAMSGHDSGTTNCELRTTALVRLHGSIWNLSCWEGCGSSPLAWRDDRVPLPDPVPHCPYCGGLARPAVVWFGETLDSADVAAALQATACDVFLSVGTSAVVYPAAGLLEQARRQGAFTAEINLEDTPATAAVDVAIRAPAEEALDALEAAL